MIFTAQNILLGNVAGAPVSTSAPAAPLADSRIEFNANVVRLGRNQMAIDQFSEVVLATSGGLFFEGSGGLAAQQDLTIAAPGITGTAGASYTIEAGGVLTTLRPAAGSAAVSGGLGASLALEGSTVSIDSHILLPSGILTLTATSGNLLIGQTSATLLDVGGTKQSFIDRDKFTDGGRIVLAAVGGSVNIGAGGTLNVAAQPGAGNAGSVTISAPTGIFAMEGAMLGAGGAGGSFALDVGSLPTTENLAAILNAGSFSEEQSIRVRTGDVTIQGLARAATFTLAADLGSIVVEGAVDASGATGGTIRLLAGGSVILEGGALLTAAAQDFSNAGKGGAITLEAGAAIAGVSSPTAEIDIRAGSTIDLSVESASPTSANFGQFTGTLHLRTPQNAAGTDVQIAAIGGNVLSASSILVEGFRVYDLTNAAGSMITSAVQTSIRNNGTAFTANSPAITTRLLGTGSPLEPIMVVAPGAEIINRAGAITLASDWDLSTFRFGPKLAPGVLTIKAAGNLVFNGALSDGFNPLQAPAGTAANLRLWLAPLMTQNTLLPTNVQSWSYRLTAGADFAAANFREVQALESLAANSGSLQLGRNGGQAIVSGGNNARTSTLIPTLYQVIRTGTGNIDIAAGRNVQLLNQFAAIYTAGVQVTNPTGLFAPNDFSTPIIGSPNQGALGAVQQVYPAQYSLAGGNVTVAAQADIAHLTRNFSNELIDDSQRQLPNNWLYRRGYADPLTGEFGLSGTVGIGAINDPSASTTWWIDFSNFFEGIGALGGGDVSLLAGHDIRNVDGLIPTNARMPGGTPDASKLVELGGGDLVVRAGHNIDGGVYYVERGKGTLSAGDEVTTNATRSPSLGNLTGFSNPEIYDPRTWLPTTLFVGKSTFDVRANGDVLLGPIANPFLLPQGVNNKHYYKTYFTTYAPDSGVSVSSLGGSLTLRQSAIRPNGSNTQSLLQIWQDEQLRLVTGTSPSASFYQPWLRLAETLTTPFNTVSALAAPSLSATAFSGDLNIVGQFSLFPSAQGSLDLTAAGAINGLQPVGANRFGTTVWSAGWINFSDADPAAVPGIANPYAYQLLVGRTNATTTGNLTIGTDILSNINLLFQESGSTEGRYAVIQTTQALHAAGVLHENDPIPTYLYAAGGNISGLTLFSPKQARIIAERDITDVAFYLQNTNPTDISLVASGRDIVLSNANSPLRTAAQAAGNILTTASLTPAAGDVQISGPGTLEVFAGRTLDLGTGASNADGTGVGITSIGNGRNPFLPFEGASIIAAVGLDLSTGLKGKPFAFSEFIDTYLAEGSPVAMRYQDEIGELLTEYQVATLDELAPELQSRVALEVFYLILRDAGRDRNDPNSPGFGNYDAGFAAIETLFPELSGQGDILTQGRDIRTRSGGSISLLAPVGKLQLADTTLGNPLSPPGIITEAGGAISIFTEGDVDIGIGRIFTLRGGNEIIWSSSGNIAAGSSAKTVQSAPPTRVLIDPQSADVATDLAGLATGGGIGVLATVAGVPPGDVDLIAPTGTIDAGDAGIRVSGNLNIAAVQVLNASNIQVAGTSGGVPTAPTVTAPNIAGLTAASNTAAASASVATEQNAAQGPREEDEEEPPSIIEVTVIGYGGGEGGV